eukprot:4995208-Prymnesium_polylepis.1
MRRCHLHSASQPSQFSSNELTTAKYRPSVLILPWLLCEQFQRVGNVYFLIISALQVVPVAVEPAMVRSGLIFCRSR